MNPHYLVALTEAVCGEQLRQYFPEYDTGETLERLIALDR